MIGHGRPLAQAPRHVDAVHVRKAEVEQDQVGRACGRLDEGLLAGRRLHEPVAVRAEARAQEAQDLRLVLHDEDQPARALALSRRLAHGRPLARGEGSPPGAA